MYTPKNKSNQKFYCIYEHCMVNFGGKCTKLRLRRNGKYAECSGSIHFKERRKDAVKFDKFFFPFIIFIFVFLFP